MYLINVGISYLEHYVFLNHSKISYFKSDIEKYPSCVCEDCQKKKIIIIFIQIVAIFFMDQFIIFKQIRKFE